MSEWKPTPLKELTNKIGSGATPKGGGESYKDFGISLIRSQNVLEIMFSKDGLAFIDEEQAHDLRNVTVEPLDVLLNITGDSVARCCMVPTYTLPARVNQHVCIIRAEKSKLVPSFLMYALNYHREDLLSLSEIGATRRALTKTMVEDFQINLPPYQEQQRIAEVLSSLDDKIDLLHRQNQTLEQLAETMFRQWFVETDEEKPLNFFGRIICGKTPSKEKKEYFNGSVPFIKIPDMHSKVFILETQDSLTEKGVDAQKNKTIPPGSICVSCIATVGLVSINTKTSQTNQQINTIVPNFEYLIYYLFNYLRGIKDELIMRASGGSVTHNLNTSDFSMIPVPYYDDEKYLKYHQEVKPLYDKIYLNCLQIKQLEQTRDTLLPKLMSGAVRVN